MTTPKYNLPTWAPARSIAAVVPNDGVDLPNAARSLYVGGAGNVKVTTTDGTTDTLVGVPAGFILPIEVTRVWATGTTAANIVALY